MLMVTAGPAYHVVHSALTDTIYAGTTNRDGRTWRNKTDVTTEACVAVAEHVIGRHDGAMTLRAPDGSGWDIEVTPVAASSSSLRADRTETR